LQHPALLCIPGKVQAAIERFRKKGDPAAEYFLEKFGKGC
jgi:hypothetical protein